MRGLGRWTAEMFLLFHLQRPDVLSGGDLGIRKAIQVEYGLEEMPPPVRTRDRRALATPPQPRFALPLGVPGGGALVRRRFSLGIAAVTLVALGSVAAAALVYSRRPAATSRRPSAKSTARAGHQMEAVAACSVDPLNSAAAFFRAEDDLSRHDFEFYGHSLISQGALGGAVISPAGDGANRLSLRADPRPPDSRTGWALSFPALA